ncbi:Intraflagellar transport protein 46-like protein [Aphelenchoides besseyi]|nr:Intraflagellar transport protein 46-like protein [Aphelenchoides besseyi]KAI6210469.1 Intraflagellar transport protein 46-like protein [Aphelenchoides besseyi]
MSFGSTNRGQTTDAVEPFKLSDDEEEKKSTVEQVRTEITPPSLGRPSSEWSLRPQSKPNLVQRLEAGDLDEFERNERDILLEAGNSHNLSARSDDLELKLEDEDEERIVDLDLERSPPPISPPARDDLLTIHEETSGDEAERPVGVFDSVQNRQVDPDIQQESPEDAFSDESDYSEGFLAENPPTSPPAYSSHPATSRQKSNENTDGLSSVIQAGGLAASLAAGAAAVSIARQENQINTSNSKMSNGVSSDEEAMDGGEIVQVDGTPVYRLSSDIRDLMHFVDSFAAERVEIQAVLRPFFLDYIPAIGDVDPFLKIPRPDQIDDQLGLLVLDEPAAVQSDPTIVDMRLRQLSNTPTRLEDAPVKKLDRADKNQQHIEQWIKNIKELRRSKPPDRVSYSRPMPELERLMDEWPSDLDVALRSLVLPTARLDCSIEEFADICLSIVDIPVNGNRIHALHLLFTLFAEFKNSQHFRSLASNGMIYGNADSSSKPMAERLEL